MKCLLGVVILCAACGAAPKSSTTPASAPVTADAPEPDEASPEQRPPDAKPRVYHLEPMTLEVVTTDSGEREVVAYDARELLDAGNAALLDDRYDDALARYDQLVADFPESNLVVPALYNAGLAHEGKGEWDAAIARYRALVTADATNPDAIDALVRMGAVMAELERWPDAVAVFEALLDRDDLSPDYRVEGLARLGYVLLQSKDYVGAEEILRSGLGYVDGLSAPLDTDYYGAMCQYYLARIPHRQFASIPIRLPDKQTERDMEAKADRVLIAHDRYLKTVEVGNPYWASAAGFQIASMQKEFWSALVTAPIPPHLGPEAAEFYVKEVHRLSRQFLEKALATHEKNVDWADQAGITTEWIEASRSEAVALADILARESAGEIVLPGEGDGAPDLGSDGSGDPVGRDLSGYVPGRVDL